MGVVWVVFWGAVAGLGVLTVPLLLVGWLVTYRAPPVDLERTYGGGGGGG